MTSVVAVPIRFFLNQLVCGLRRLTDLLTELTFEWLMGRRVRRSIPPINSDLLLFSAVTLARKIRLKEITSEELVRRCIERINEVQPFLNAVVDERFQAALEDARAADRIVGCLSDKAVEALEKDAPFFGVPFSTKECIKVKGMHHSCGTMARAKVVAKEDAEVVALLRKAGAIPLCVTNVSELCSWWESSNAVYGRSNNPYNCLRTPGGSTGGEAALQSAAGVPISIGSDTGGSIGIPATFCGLFAHKISGGASSVAGTFVADPPKGWAVTMQSVGPLSRHVDDLLPLVQTLCCSAEEAKRPNLSGDGGDVALSRLRYFFMDGGIGGPGVSPPSPEVKQALHRVVNFIEDYLAVDVRPVRFPAMEGAFQLFEASVEQEVFGYVPAFSEFMNHSVLGEWVCWLLRSSEHELPFLMLVTMEALDGLLDKVRSALGGNPGPRGSISPGDLHRIETFRNEFQELLGDDGVLLCPPFPGVATYHGEACMKPLNVMYSAIFNVLGAPATIVPVGLSRKENMPLAVQIVAAPMNDNLTLAVAKMLERPFGGWVPPFSPNSNEFYY